jgi:chitin disaccharide deacetylase
MLIINADDWGRSVAETDAALRCYKEARITSASAMVFMEDSERAAELAKENDLDVGLHLNFTEPFTGGHYLAELGEQHARTIRYLVGNKYDQLVCNPFLRSAFSYLYEAQSEEFARLFGKPPSHIDGHHHMHLCANLLFSDLIPASTKLRRNFSFWPGEKSIVNRTYRSLVDRWLARRYQLPDYFFDLTQCIQQKKLDRLTALAKSSNVELMTHPIVASEAAFLMGHEFTAILRKVEKGTYARMGSVADQLASPLFVEEDHLPG